MNPSYDIVIPSPIKVATLQIRKVGGVIIPCQTCGWITYTMTNMWLGLHIPCQTCGWDHICQTCGWDHMYHATYVVEITCTMLNMWLGSHMPNMWLGSQIPCQTCDWITYTMPNMWLGSVWDKQIYHTKYLIEICMRWTDIPCQICA